MYTNKDKIKVLNNILNDYSKYFKYFGKAKAYYLGLNFIILFTENSYKNKYNLPFKRKFPIHDIDKIIARYRSKRDYEINKFIAECMSNRVCHKINKIPDRLLNVKFF